jgi:hypothetical protein
MSLIDKRWLMSSILAVLALPSAAIAQPSEKDSRTSTERASYGKALCVYRAMTEASRVFTSATTTKITPEAKAQAKASLDQFQQAARRAIRACLTEREVYELGRFSYLEVMTFAEGSPCKLAKAPATRFQLTPNNNDGDIVNGAVHWADVTQLDAHPFFNGQSAARQEFRNLPRTKLCEAILSEFGPTGTRFAGLVRGR